jgi:signal peptidase II
MMRFSGYPRWIFFVGIAIGGFLLDWLTKLGAVHSLAYAQPVPVIGKYFQFMLVYNTGALFGLNPRTWLPGFPVNLFFYIFSAFAVVLLVLYYKSIRPEKRLLHWGVALVMPGALGNLLDRVMHPARGVVDFLRLGVSDTLYWPIFNLADVYITIGVILILLEFVSEELNRKKLKVES